MKIIHNHIIPFRGYDAINVLGILFCRKGIILSSNLIQHERIHTAQMIEMGVVGFYLWYVIEWLSSDSEAPEMKLSDAIDAVVSS